MGVVEDAEPVELRFGDEVLQDGEVFGGFARKTDNEVVRRAMPGTAARTLGAS